MKKRYVVDAGLRQLRLTGCMEQRLTEYLVGVRFAFQQLRLKSRTERAK